MLRGCDCASASLRTVVCPILSLLTRGISPLALRPSVVEGARIRFLAVDRLMSQCKVTSTSQPGPPVSGISEETTPAARGSSRTQRLGHTTASRHDQLLTNQTSRTCPYWHRPKSFGFEAQFQRSWGGFFTLRVPRAVAVHPSPVHLRIYGPRCRPGCRGAECCPSISLVDLIRQRRQLPPPSVHPR